MSQFQLYLAILASGLCAAALGLTLLSGAEPTLLLHGFLVLGALSLLRLWLHPGLWLDSALAVLGAVAVLASFQLYPGPPAFLWLALVATWLWSWVFVERLSDLTAPSLGQNGGLGLLIPLTFGLAILVTWEAITRGAGVPQVILPPPSQIGSRIAASLPTLWTDFQQTFLKAVLAGYAIGCGVGFLVAILIDRSPFLKSGLLPLGSFVSALPIVGVAPIMVMWFGFDWQSKAAVVVIMTFFPMLVNTIAGLNAASAIERDLMRTYAASYWQTLLKLRLPAAAPFIFNALKICSTLALIGAIVAEFFGSPVAGMGFRISAEIGRMNVDMVWAEIAMAALAGSVFYGVVALVERGITFWHPSMRRA
ncbi:ABC transporter permease [Devosia sp. 1566]|uniref:ABC transporter permease n=1 Tax=Devosia sp. 1566 TaxID=2499144 RepID=UPI000FD7F601|nr:ABC transporter permease [Devosia sp. 1566]